MSRSRHTDPKTVRAARRVHGPFAVRGANDRSRSRQLRRSLKELGQCGILEERWGIRHCVRPRIVVRRPRPGFHHPAGKQQILGVLDAIGPVAIYGLRSVELVRTPNAGRSPALVFGRYQAPGRIVLYEQPRPPWRLQGRLAAETARRLERAGAVVTPLTEAGATCVTWPGAALQRFMLQDVLLHEVGHHILQQHKGKRLVRVARTRDHEAFAARFAEKQRAARRQRRGPTA